MLASARLNASHLYPGELEALSVAGLDDELLGRLGLTTAHERAVRKIAAREAAAPEVPGFPGAATMARLADLVLVDSSAWLAGSGTEVDVAELAWALRQRRRIRIEYRRSAETKVSPVVVDPYGLVVKSGRWYLIADVQGAGRMFAVERLSSYALLDAQAALRPGQTLRSVWAALKERTESRGGVSIQRAEGVVHRRRAVSRRRVSASAAPVRRPHRDTPSPRGP